MPAGQGVHTDSPGVGPYVPGGQDMQLAARSTPCASETLAEMNLEATGHAPVPTTSVYVPAKHGVQSDAEVELRRLASAKVQGGSGAARTP